MKSFGSTVKKVPGWVIFFIVAFTLYLLAKATK